MNNSNPDESSSIKKEFEQKLAEKDEELNKSIRDFSKIKDKLRNKTTQLVEAETKIETLEQEVKKQKASIKQLNEWNDSKAHELMEKDKKIDEQTTQITDLQNQIADLKRKLEELRHPSTESEGPSPTEEPEEFPTFAKVEKEKAETTQPVKKVQKRPIYLHFEGNQFVRVRRMPSSGISLIFDPKEFKWILTWTADAGFVSRRTAERQARSIANTGYSDGDISRAGQGYPLDIMGEDSVPDRLLRDQHQY